MLVKVAFISHTVSGIQIRRLDLTASHLTIFIGAKSKRAETSDC